MHVLIVYAHPEPTSFTAALRDAALAAIEAEGHSAEVSDLYGEGFNPVAGRHDFVTTADPDRFHYQTEQAHAAEQGGFSAELRREQDRVARADLLILVYPLWWGGPPAIVKGWFDRVLAYGFAYVDGRRFASGLFKGRRGLMAVSTGGTPQRFSAGDAYGEIDQVLWPVRRLALEYMGLDVLPPFVAYAAPRVTDEARQAYLSQWQQVVREALRLGPVIRAEPEPGLLTATSWSSAG